MRLSSIRKYLIGFKFSNELIIKKIFFFFFLFKYYVFKAQYKSGAEEFAKSKKLDYAWIRKDELSDFIKNKDYLDCLNNIILDF